MRGIILVVFAIVTLGVGGNPVQCTVGKFCSGTNAEGCQNCAPGTSKAEQASPLCNTDGSTSTACDQCPVGQFSDGGAGTKKACTACATGKIANAPGTSACADCPVGREANSAKTDCDICPTGKHSQGGAGSPKICTPCPSNTFTASAGAGSCAACDGGKYTKSGTCAACPSGTYGTGSAGACTACPSGKYQGQSGQLECKVCNGWARIAKVIPVTGGSEQASVASAVDCFTEGWWTPNNPWQIGLLFGGIGILAGMIAYRAIKHVSPLYGAVKGVIPGSQYLNHPSTTFNNAPVSPRAMEMTERSTAPLTY